MQEEEKDSHQNKKPRTRSESSTSGISDNVHTQSPGVLPGGSSPHSQGSSYLQMNVELNQELLVAVNEIDIEGKKTIQLGL